MYKYMLFILLATVVGAAPRFSTRWDMGLERTPERPRCALPHSLDEDSLHQYDALWYRVELGFDLDAETLGGHALLAVVADEVALDRLDFRFTESLAIDSIWTTTHDSLFFTRWGEDSLQIYLFPSVAVSDTVEIGVAYHGHPETVDAWGGMRFGQESGWRPQIAFSMGDGLDMDPPPANYTWLPSWADPTDKVLWEARIETALDRVATTNGIRLSAEEGDSSIVWHYRLDQPVSTYLLFVSVSDYEIMVQRETDPLIENFVYPSRTTHAAIHFEYVPQVLDGFVELFGPYPFDRFGNNMTRIGDMEHATCVSHFDQTVLGNHSYDGLLFHELSHMWWGDWVTIGDWRDLWLNEGFASYCEALGHGIAYGEDAYHDYVEDELMPTARSAGIFTIYDPRDYWSSVVYEKGACVLHMLRWVMGDSSFFRALREYGEEHAYGSAVTTDFQAKCEEYYGESLNWFFDPWVYEGTRYPRYHVYGDWNQELEITIRQGQPGETFFRMPMEISYYSDGEPVRVDTVWTEADPESYSESVGDADSIRIDPHNWILKLTTYHAFTPADDVQRGVPAEFAMKRVYPNPFNPKASISFDLPRTSTVELSVFDVLGRQVSSTIRGDYAAGEHTISWDGSEHPSGVYLFRLSAGDQARVSKAILLK